MFDPSSSSYSYPLWVQKSSHTHSHSGFGSPMGPHPQLRDNYVLTSSTNYPDFIHHHIGKHSSMNHDLFIHPSEKKSVLQDQYKKWSLSGLMANSASTHSYKQDKCTRMKYPWVIGFELLLPKPILVYPMGGDFVSYSYPWGQFLSHTRTLIEKFSTG
jgi:hypothetical protein